MVARALDVLEQVPKGLGSAAMSSSSWNLSSISRALCTAQHEASLSQCWDGARSISSRVRHVCIWQVIEFLALQGRRGLPVCRVRKGGGCVSSIRAGAGLAAFLLQGLSEEQLSGTSLGYVPFGML
jgi:hypothetical protein